MHCVFTGRPADAQLGLRLRAALTVGARCLPANMAIVHKRWKISIQVQEISKLSRARTGWTRRRSTPLCNEIASSDHPLVVANRSQHICTDPKLSAQYVKEAAAYFAKHRQEPTKAFNFVGFETYYNYMRGTSRQTNRLYVCASYIYQAVLGLNQTQSATIPIDNQNAICLLGYHGRQINRHHMIPTWLQDIANGSIVTKGTFGNGFSKDLLLVHQRAYQPTSAPKHGSPPRINTGRQEKWMTDVRTITFTRACMKARIETSLQAPRAPV